MTGHRNRWIVRKNRASRRRFIGPTFTEHELILEDGGTVNIEYPGIWAWFDATCERCRAGDWHHDRHGEPRPFLGDPKQPYIMV